jgi:uncharacterized glyoxalase superfamily metalloenzyme YdcJ
LRQTAFKAIEENVRFKSSDGAFVDSSHTARFGEIEQRGVALTPKGRALYDTLLNKVLADITPSTDGSNAIDYSKRLVEVFKQFPDDWREMHEQGLAYFRYSVNEAQLKHDVFDVPSMLDDGALTLTPIVYEDFLPVSAAGIFQSNLGDKAAGEKQASASREQFELALGKTIIDEFELYESIQNESLKSCMESMQTLGNSA